MSESSHAERTDAFEDKLRLLEDAWRRKDYRLTRALTHSLRATAMQAQADAEMPDSPPLLAARASFPVAELPPAWKTWAAGWSHCHVLHIDEPLGLNRAPEPVEVGLAVPLAHSTSLAREVRVARIEADGALREIPSQTFGEIRRGNERLCRVLFLAGGAMHERQSYLIFHGNADAELPDYPTDLATSGEGFALDIENDHYRASLSRQMGQLERMTIKREHGLELFAGGEGHGEPPCIDWAHDYAASGHFQKFRITLWETCPDYEVVRGPLATIVRRWGFPHSPVHPVFTPSRLHVDVEYRFYAGLPWFHKSSAMSVIRDFEVTALRDDEWVFSGQSFTDIVWMGSDGKLRSGPVDAALRENLWAVGFANPRSQDSFVALFLEHHADGLPELLHNGSPTLFYRWHGAVWSRYPLPVKQLPAGAVLRQKNAYSALPFSAEDGPRRLEELRHCLTNPPALSLGEARDVAALSKASPGRLARAGETGDGPISKRALWEALADCKDEQLYRAGISVADLGLVFDIRVRGATVHVTMTMPHRGRPRLGYFTQGSGGNSEPVRQRLLRVPGVEKVLIEPVWEPGWNSNRLTPEGRKKLGLPD